MQLQIQIYYKEESNGLHFHDVVLPHASVSLSEFPELDFAFQKIFLKTQRSM